MLINLQHPPKRNDNERSDHLDRLKKAKITHAVIWKEIEMPSC